MKRHVTRDVTSRTSQYAWEARIEELARQVA